jgi:hypothetical protein
MTAKGFRRIALSLPDTEEGSHMGHADFRVAGKIFATFPDAAEKRGMVKLPPATQKKYIKSAPETFSPGPGAWGKAGATFIDLAQIDAATLRQSLLAAWRNTAPRRLVEALGPSDDD